MAEKKLFEFKKIDGILSSNIDCSIDKFFGDIKIIHSAKNDILIKMGKKNEWLSKDEIYITGYKKEIQIDAPFTSDYNVIFLKSGSKYMDKLLNKHFILKTQQKLVLNQLYEEYKKSLLNPGSEISAILLKSLCEQFFMYLLRDSLKIEKVRKTNKSNEETVRYVISYLTERLGENVKFPEILKKAGVSSTGLKNLFKEYTGMGVMQYFSYLKIEKAKGLLLEGDYNATQIANILGYDSIHYFSRQFKKITGLSPTGYVNQMTSGS